MANETDKPEKQVFSTKDLAERWDMHEDTVRSSIKRGTIPAFRVGRAYLISAAVVEKLEKLGA
jgi:excisionase family DNA binding protein